MENPSNIQPDQVIVVEGDAGFVPKAEPSDAGKVLGVVNASGDVGWVEASGGQLTQVQADWAETDPTQVSYIDNKPDLSVYATSSAVDTALAGKQDVINDLSDIRAGAEAGSTAVQPSALDSYATTSAMNTALAGKQDTISDLSDIRAGAAKGDTAVQPAALNDYATTAAMDTALAGKQDVISDLSDIRSGASAGATAVQPSALDSYATTSAMNTALAGKQDVINDLSDIRSGAAAGATAVQPAALEDYATVSAMNTALAGKQNTISDLDTIRSGAAAGSTAVQPSQLPSSDELVPSATSGDSGKVLTVDAQGDPAWITPAGGSDVVTANGNFKLGGAVPVKVNYTGSQEYERGSLQLVNTFAYGTYAVAVFEIVGAHSIYYETYGSATVTINEAMDIAGTGITDFAITFLNSDSNWNIDGQIYKNPSPTVTDGKIVAQSLSFYSISQYATGTYLGVGVKVTNNPNESEKVAAVVQQLANGAVSISDWPTEQILATTIPNIPAATSADEDKVLTVDSNGTLVWAASQGGGGTVDQTYNASSTNAQSGTAVAGALATVNQVPASTSSDEDKVLTVNSSGNPVWAEAAAPYSKPLVAGSNITITDGANDVTIAATDTTYTAGDGIDITSGVVSADVDGSTIGIDSTTKKIKLLSTIPTVDQTYSASSANAQSGVAVASAISGINSVPASTSADQDKVLTVNSSGTPVWAAAQGGGGGGGGSGGDSEFPYDPGYMHTGWNKMVVRFGDTSYDPTNKTSAGAFTSIIALNEPGVYEYTFDLTSSRSRVFQNEWNDFTNNPIDVLQFTPNDSYFNVGQLFYNCSGLRSVWNWRGQMGSAEQYFKGCSNLEIVDSKAPERWAALTSEGSLSDSIYDFGVQTSGASQLFTNCSKLRKANIFIYIWNDDSGSAENACMDLRKLEVGPCITGQCSLVSCYSGCFNMARLYGVSDFPALVRILGNSSYGYPSYVFSMDSAFYDCRALVDLNGWNIGGAFRSITYAFYNCGIAELPLIRLAQTGAVNASNAFKNCKGLKTVPLTDYGQIANASDMLQNCESLTDVSPLTPLANACTNVNNLIAGCCNVVKGVEELYTALSGSETINTHDYTFSNVGSNAWNDQRLQIPSSWGGLEE